MDILKLVSSMKKNPGKKGWDNSSPDKLLGIDEILSVDYSIETDDEYAERLRKDEQSKEAEIRRAEQKLEDAQDNLNRVLGQPTKKKRMGRKK